MWLIGIIFRRLVGCHGLKTLAAISWSVKRLGREEADQLKALISLGFILDLKLLVLRSMDLLVITELFRFLFRLGTFVFLQSQYSILLPFFLR